MTIPGGRKTSCATAASRLLAEDLEAVTEDEMASSDSKKAAVTLPAEVQRSKPRDGSSALDNMVKGCRIPLLMGPVP